MGYIRAGEYVSTGEMLTITGPDGSAYGSIDHDSSGAALIYLNTLTVPVGTKAKFGEITFTYNGSAWTKSTGGGFSWSSIGSGLQSILGAIIGGSKSGAPAAQQSSSFPIVPVAIAGVVAVGAIFFLTRKGKRK